MVEYLQILHLNGGIMAKCPIFIHALVTQRFESAPIHKATDINSGWRGIDCIESGCQMWNSESKDCGLKNPTKVVLVPNDQDEPDPEEKDLTPVPFPKNPVKQILIILTQDPWTCPE